MPLSQSFKRRLYPHVPTIIAKFGSPAFIYDEAGIKSTGLCLNTAFEGFNFKEFFAVKALPNDSIMKVMRSMGFGFDCSSVHELQLAASVGATGCDVMFTSNNTSTEEFKTALDMGVILNLDDISMVEPVKRICKSMGKNFPDHICFRFNPGRARKGTSIIGKPQEAKYGVTDKQFVPAYKRAFNAGATTSGIHSMICSNQRNWRYHAATTKMLLERCEVLEKATGKRCRYINVGGGWGVNYRPSQQPLDTQRLTSATRRLLMDFNTAHGWAPSLFMENGRFMAGPHGALVTKVINRKDTYETHIGVDACPMASIPRPFIYGAYHHIDVLDPSGRVKGGQLYRVNVVGPACENTDRFATRRLLPFIELGDIIVVHEAGAHSIAMRSNYNGRTAPQELLRHEDGMVEQIRRAETTEDLWRTLREASHEMLQT